MSRKATKAPIALPRLAGGTCRVDDFDVTGNKLRAHGHDAATFDQDVADSPIGELGVHGHYGAAFEQGALRICHDALHRVD